MTKTKTGDGDELTREIKREVATIAQEARRSTNSSVADSDSGILDACRKAADYIRDVYNQHSSESETLALHIEQVGKKFYDHCHDIAQQIRELRLMPQEIAGKHAEELLHFGKLEQERHANVTQSLKAMGNILLAINAAKDASADSDAADVEPHGTRAIDSGRKD